MLEHAVEIKFLKPNVTLGNRIVRRIYMLLVSLLEKVGTRPAVQFSFAYLHETDSSTTVDGLDSVRPISCRTCEGTVPP